MPTPSTSSDPVDRLSPAAVRRKVLRELGLDEPMLDQLKVLPPKEAQWRIEHEHKVMVQYLATRRRFMLEDCVTKRTPLAVPRGRKKTAPQIVRPDSRLSGAKGVMGTSLG